ncbi:hypothetical protein B7463_g8212, partial [Scytalidium lignicola]
MLSKRNQKAVWVAWRKKESHRKKAIKQLPHGIVGVPALYKEHTPPSFPEPGKEPIDQKLAVTSTVNLLEIPLHKPPQISIQHTIRTSFARPELQEEKQQVEQQVEQQEQQQEGEGSEGSEESFIPLDLEGEFGYSCASSDSDSSSSSGDSSEEGYYKLW